MAPPTTLKYWPLTWWSLYWIVKAAIDAQASRNAISLFRLSSSWIIASQPSPRAASAF